MTKNLTILAFASLVLALGSAGCLTVEDDGPTTHGVELFLPTDDLADEGSIPTSRSGQDLEEAGDPGLGDPSGRIVIDQSDLLVHVGDEVLVHFEAQVDNVSRDDVEIVVTGLPDGAELDFAEGTFYWIPGFADIGVHAIGLDLWYTTDDRILDAQRFVIEVIPREDLIEVGI